MGEDHLNLREMVLDSLFASLPLLPVCRHDCRGICPRCGADRNTAACACQEVEIDPRWSGPRCAAAGARRPGPSRAPSLRSG